MKLFTSLIIFLTQRFLKEEKRVALRTQQIGLGQFCYQGRARQIAKALLSDDRREV
ncbi:hypothetical protein [Holospora undulata]|uniref:Uncharacterized protein n=1 Tax=Holospora undulata HU1 TaxID=1321371 RepID=A0A061JHA3_9PROT|nr:hypothetical protein [Holospora undulata]ETZ05545.1 hypothetical protein K737_300015 [Holospora undulata HU1]